MRSCLICEIYKPNFITKQFYEKNIFVAKNQAKIQLFCKKKLFYKKNVKKRQKNKKKFAVFKKWYYFCTVIQQLLNLLNLFDLWTTIKNQIQSIPLLYQRR